MHNSLPFDEYLMLLSNQYSLNGDQARRGEIMESFNDIKDKLYTEFGDYGIETCKIFGSYERDTILNTTIDPDTSIDVLILFAHTDNCRDLQQYYRVKLRNFALKYYWKTGSHNVIWSFPYVSVLLGNLLYRLVPSRYEKKFWYSYPRVLIPSVYGWQQTRPNEMKEKLLRKDLKYQHIVTPMVRLLKAWNANNGFPYDVFELEKAIIDMRFRSYTLRQGLFHAVKKLKIGWFDSGDKKDKIKALKYNINQTKQALAAADTDRAKATFHLMFPITQLDNLC